MLQLLLYVTAACAAIVFALYVHARHGRRIDVSPAAYPWAERVAERGLDAVAEDLLSRMSLREKIAQLSGGSVLTLVKLGINRYLHGGFPNVYTGHSARLRIPPISFSDGPRGVVVGRGTCFPVTMARGASWDRELERRFNPQERRWEVEAMTYTVYVGSSSRPRDLQRAQFEVG